MDRGGLGPIGLTSNWSQVILGARGVRHLAFQYSSSDIRSWFIGGNQAPSIVCPDPILPLVYAASARFCFINKLVRYGNRGAEAADGGWFRVIHVTPKWVLPLIDFGAAAATISVSAQ
jgi:hypothetical protein